MNLSAVHTEMGKDFMEKEGDCLQLQTFQYGVSAHVLAHASKNECSE